MASRIGLGIALSAMIALVSGAAQANLISDGTFTADGQGFYAVGSVLGGGAWTVTTGQEANRPGYSGIDLSQNYWAAPPGGGNSVDLDGFYPGGITQSFATTVGASYWISFYLAGNPDTTNNPNPIKYLQVTAGGTTEDFNFDTSSTSDNNMGYVSEGFGFTANATTTTLAFTSLDAGTQASGPVVGDIQVAAPEPASLALLLVGGFGIGMVRRRGPRAAGC